MKRIALLLTALLLVLSLASCGGGVLPEGILGSEAQIEGVSGIDFGSIMAGNGATDTVWGNQDPATQQAIIDAAEKEGMEVSFAPDGSMTVTDKDGSVTVQKPDGTWVVKDADGTEGQLGGNWPDNEFTKLLPKPEFELLGASTDENSFTVAFLNVSAEQVREYAQQVKEKGFDIDAATEDETVMGITVFTYTAKNSEGYTVEISFAMSTSGITVTKP